MVRTINQIKEYQKIWRSNNKQKVQKYQLKYRLENKEKTKLYKQQYYIENKEHIKNHLRLYRQKHKKKLNKQCREWYATHKEHVRNYKLQWLYNFSSNEYYNLLKQQNGICAICKQKPSTNKILHIDHNHKNGKIRGLLCNICNQGLGLFKDNPQYLTNATQYLYNTHKGDKK